MAVGPSEVLDRGGGNGSQGRPVGAIRGIGVGVCSFGLALTRADAPQGGKEHPPTQDCESTEPSTTLGTAEWRGGNGPANSCLEPDFEPTSPEKLAADQPSRGWPGVGGTAEIGLVAGWRGAPSFDRGACIGEGEQQANVATVLGLRSRLRRVNDRLWGFQSDDGMSMVELETLIDALQADLSVDRRSIRNSRRPSARADVAGGVPTGSISIGQHPSRALHSG